MLDFLVDLGDLVTAVRRVADALDRAVPPIVVEERPKSSRVGVVSYGNEESRWVKEQLTALVKPRGLSPAAEKSLLEEMLSSYQQEMDHKSDGH